MKAIMFVSLCICALIYSCTCADAYTLTFDEFPSGTELHDTFYETDYGAAFGSGFRAMDHMASAWGQPHSEKNVLIWDSDYSPGYLLFGHASMSAWERWNIYSTAAYFSTQPGAMVRITAYHYSDSQHTEIPVTSLIIGAPDESWDNRYVEIDSSNGVFDMLEFEGVSSPDDLRGFCADDMTIIPVPEPTSLLALVFGLLPVGVVAMRRRRK